MKITRRQLKRIIKETSSLTDPTARPGGGSAATPQEAPATGDEAYGLGYGRGRAGRPDQDYKTIEAWLAANVDEEIAEAYLHGYKIGQSELDIEYMGMWDDDDDDDEPRDHPADTIADELGLERQPLKMRRRSTAAVTRDRSGVDAAVISHPPEVGHGSIPDRFIERRLRLTKKQLDYIIKESVRKHKNSIF